MLRLSFRNGQNPLGKHPRRVLRVLWKPWGIGLAERVRSARGREHGGRTTGFRLAGIAGEASYPETAVGTEPIYDGTALAAGCSTYGNDWSGVGQGIHWRHQNRGSELRRALGYCESLAVLFYAIRERQTTAEAVRRVVGLTLISAEVARLIHSSCEKKERSWP